MSEYKPGTMDVSDKEKTFEGFVKFAARFAAAVIVFLILLAMING